jgi:leucyl aminopeptidase (aminopeptidase T)
VLKHPPPIDFARWAKFIVRDFFAVQPYERVVLMTDPTYYPELTDAIRAELVEAKAIEIGSILFDGPAMSSRRSTVRPRATDERYRTDATAAMRRLYEQADIFMWLPYRFGPGTERGDGRMLERLVEGTRARGLHFHWIENLAQLSQADIDETTKLYASALDIDYAALSARQDRLIAAMRGRELTITSPLGTDLRVRVTGTSWIHKGDGRMDAARAAQARSVRDREMELPAGALRFIPDVNSAEGVLVVPRWSGGEDVRFVFRGGRVVSVTARTEQEQVDAGWARATGDKDRIAEMVIGTNPRLPSVGPAGRLPYYGYGAGILRIALGENWESGGPNRSSLEAWFYLADTSVQAGGTALIRNGRLVLE